VAELSAYIDFDGVFFKSFTYYVRERKCIVQRPVATEITTANLLRFGTIVGGQNTFYRRRVFDRVQFNAENKYSMDYELLLELAKLDAFFVQSTKETNASAIAVNEQRVANNIKSVVAAEEFGTIPDTNPGELLKWLPGVGVEYFANNITGVNVRGLGAVCITYCVGGLKVANTTAEAFAGAPNASTEPAAPFVPGTPRPEPTAEQKAERAAKAAELAKWRASASLDKFKQLRKMYNDAGVSIYAWKPSALDVKNSDAEIDYAFRVAKELGAGHMTVELPTDPVERDVEDALLVGPHLEDGAVEPIHAALLRDAQALVAPDDHQPPPAGTVPPIAHAPVHDQRLDHAEVFEAALEARQLVVGHAARVVVRRLQIAQHQHLRLQERDRRWYWIRF